MALMQQIKILILSVSHDVLLTTSVGRPLVDWVFLGIQVTESRHINVDLAQIGLHRILFDLETTFLLFVKNTLGGCIQG